MHFNLHPKPHQWFYYDNPVKILSPFQCLYNSDKTVRWHIKMHLWLQEASLINPGSTNKRPRPFLKKVWHTTANFQECCGQYIGQILYLENLLINAVWKKCDFQFNVVCKLSKEQGQEHHKMIQNSTSRWSFFSRFCAIRNLK